MKPAIYLAGPEVFLKDAQAIGGKKKEMLSKFGLAGLYPMDNELPPDAENAAMRIAQANYEIIDRCDAVIANLTPFRGPSADIGTACEAVYAFAKGKPVFAYSNVMGEIRERIAEDGMAIEDFGLFDNLMLPYAIEKSGGGMHFIEAKKTELYTDLRAFEMAAKAAATSLLQF